MRYRATINNREVEATPTAERAGVMQQWCPAFQFLAESKSGFNVVNQHSGYLDKTRAIEAAGRDLEILGFERIED